MSELRRITERYHLEKRISSKNSGTVFRAVDALSGEVVAVKLINTGDAEEQRETFEAHLTALQSVDHLVLPRILDFGFTTAGSAFLVTEYLAGDDLADLVDIPPARVLTLLLQLVDGLEALAARGLTMRNLSAENLRIVTGPEGEQVKILGLGSAVFLGEDIGVSGPLSDLRAFAELAVRALSLPAVEEGDASAVTLPFRVASALAEPERLRELLDTGLRGDAGGWLSDWKEVRRTLQTARFGVRGSRPAADTVTILAPPTSGGSVEVSRTVPILLQDIEAKLAPAEPPPSLPPTLPVPIPGLSGIASEAEDSLPVVPQVPQPNPAIPPPPPPPPAAGPVAVAERVQVLPPVVPPPPPPPPALAPAKAAPQVAPWRAPWRREGKGLHLALVIGAPAALVLLLIGGLMTWQSLRAAPPAPPPKKIETAPPKPAQRPVQPPVPKPVHAQILVAEEALNASDLAKARAALDSIPPEQLALFTAEEQGRYQRDRDALALLESQQWDEDLTRGLRTGDLKLLRAAVASLPVAATLTPEQKKNLARAGKILDLDSKLSKAQQAKNQPETLRQASLLLAELPGYARARRARTQAAEALLAEADARAGQGELDAALATLESLQAVWSDHPGLAERLERIRAEQRVNERMEETLAAADRAERAERPLEGIQALDRIEPNERWAGRFQQARERLQAQFAQLDRNPPQITMSGPAEPSYEKGATVTISLRITDDQGVESVAAWGRPAAGHFTRVSVRRLSGSDYELEFRPDLHQNKNIDFYVEATDRSGHKGSLGSAQSPQKVKRKKWLDKIRGDREGGSGGGEAGGGAGAAGGSNS